MMSPMKPLPRPQINVKVYSACHVDTVQTLNSSDIYFVITNNIARYSIHTLNMRQIDGQMIQKSICKKKNQMKSKRVK